MLGKHYIVSQVPGLEQTAEQTVPWFGTLGDVHADTVVFSWVIMLLILGFFGAVVKPQLVADGPGGPIQ
ncbi:MAG: hypothetical protein K2Z81_21695, partial [Cyanobacteria bacterium]|nr:hypothetical protein [Cyanobacteriota bacterium]